MAAFTDYKALDFSGIDKAVDKLGKKWSEDRSNEAIFDYMARQSGQSPTTALRDLSADYGKTETAPAPSPVESRPLPKVGVQVAENEQDTQRLEGQMAAGQGPFARQQPQQAAPQQQYGDRSLPRGIRNNNPGNIEAGNFAASVPGFQGSDGRFARYETPEQGIQAADKLLVSYAGRGLNTVSSIVNRWAPPSENDTGAYAATVAKELGVDPNQPLDMNNPQIRSGIIRAKIRVENGKQPYGDEVFARAYGGNQPASQPQAQPQIAVNDQRTQYAQAQGGPQSDMPAQGAAQAQGFVVPGGMQPANRQNIDVQQLKGLIQAGGDARKLGLALFQQAQTGKSFGFMTGPDGAIYRTDPRSGGLERLTEPTRSQAQELDIQGKRLANEKAERELRGGGVRSLITPEERTAAGVDPNYKGTVQIDREGKVSYPGKASSEVSIKNEGTIPPGFRVKRDAQGNPSELEPIPGGPAAAKAATADQKAAAQQQAKQQTGNVVLTAIDDIDRLMKEATLPTTGALGSKVAGIKGTASHDIASALTTIGANISFDALSQMRAASPTGGALGAVTERELELLQNSAAALQQSQSEGQFRANLGRVRANFEKVVHGKTLTAQERKAGGPMTAERATGLREEARAAIAAGAPKASVAKRLYEQYGITPDGL